MALGMRLYLIVGLVAVIAIAAVAVTLSSQFTSATGHGDSDEPITGPALQQATNAALEHTGGGTVIETEIGDDGAAYGVEIRRDDGSEVEVNLDENFNVIGEEADDDSGGDDDNDGDSD